MEVEVVRISARLELLLLILAAMLFAGSCAPSVVATLHSTPEPTVFATLAPTVAPTATAAPSPTPTAVPTPATDELSFTEERRAELKQQFQDFLNKEGEFTPEEISSITTNK